jgi:hypothetical protein
MDDNLMTGLIRERDRVRDMLKEYEAIGPAGMFGAAMIKADLKRADDAIATGDVVEMIAALKELQGCQ